MPYLNENAELHHIRVYVDDEFATMITCIRNKKYPNTSVIEYIWDGYDQLIYWEDYHNLPTRGMIYNNKTFLDGENGETFRKHLPAFDFAFFPFIFIKDNKVLGYYLVADSMPSNELIVAALKSNPRFEILPE